MTNVFAHSVSRKDVGSWQALSEHADGVAMFSEAFGRSFSSEKWCRLLGEIHDLGKCRSSFQNYLLNSNGVEKDGDSTDHTHSGAGAVWAVERLFPKSAAGRILAYCVAGHHAGLPDSVGGIAPNGALNCRLEDEKTTVEEEPVAKWISEHEKDWLALRPRPPWRFAEGDVSFWIRMLYSCLVDADFLDTERFCDGIRARRRGVAPSIQDLAARFFAQLDAFQSRAPRTNVNQIRAEVRYSSEESALRDTGLFSLTVPTGGGKTLSAMAFAFRHALKHNLKRIIYVIPYTSIIEQTADVLRGILGDDAVVEHHSNLDPDDASPSARLATENWDATVVVTTSVQFFESLYACRSSRCRKLHNIAQSVVILDEVQLLPPNLLWPCTEALAQLVAHYGTTVLLSTATQPALGVAGPLSNIAVHPIIKDERSLYDRLKRVAVEMPKNLQERRDWDSLTEELNSHQQVLCIVNGKKDCRALVERMSDGSTFYLTTNLCGMDRSLRIAEIKRRLSAGEPVRVVSTQLIEAGVDVDFPVVYRAFTGYSSIVQAAGRCNREGKKAQLGRVIVFMPPEPSPVGMLRKAEDAMAGMLSQGTVSFDDPGVSRIFFESFYSRQNDNGKDLFKRLLVDGARDCSFQFREAAEAFKMISDDTVPVVVRFDPDGSGFVDKMLAAYFAIGRPTRDVMRKLQRYVVNVYRSRIPSLLEKGFVEELPPSGSSVYVQTLPSLYDRYGLDLDREGLSVDDCIC